MDITRPLEGVKVIDLTTIISGPMCTQILGDQGADVIKVEKPIVGDLARSMGGWRGGFGGAGLMMNRSKRSIMLDVKLPEGVQILRDLVRDADVMVANMRPGVDDRLGIDYEDMKKINPDIIFVSVTGFGLTGPNIKRQVFDSVIQGSMVFARQQADPETGKPQMFSTYVVDKVTALTTAQAITAALLHREKGGGGQHLQMAMMDAGLHFVWLDGMWNHTFVGEGMVEFSYLNETYKVIETKNGFITILIASQATWEGLCRALKREDWLEDPRFSTIMALVGHMEDYQTMVKEEIAKWDTDELCERLYAEELAAAKVLTREEVFDDAQVIHNETLIEYTHPTAGVIRQPRPPALYDGRKTEINMPAPTLGQHTDEILAEIGRSSDDIAKLREANVVGDLPPGEDGLILV